MREIIQALKQVIQILEWEREIIDEFQSYARKYGAPLGGNVFKFVLDDARRLRLKQGEP
jgi:hypothetical protein